MIDAEKLLGGLLRQSLTGGRRRNRRRRRSSGGSLGGFLTGAGGMALLGAAIAAYDHFVKKPAAQPSPPAPSGSAGPPPPPPGSPTRTVPPPPPPGASPVESANAPALLLLRAMIAAANADGHIDMDEKVAILEELGRAGMTEEEKLFVERELGAPPSIDSLLRQVDSPELARQLYSVSLLAIEVDSKAEEQYLQYLKVRLGLDDDTVRSLHAQFEGADET